MTKAVLPSPNVFSNFYYQWKNLFIYFQNDNHRGKIENICIVTWVFVSVVKDKRSLETKFK